MSETPEELAEMDATAQRVVGKPLLECTAEDMQTIVSALIADVFAIDAAVERADMALRDVKDCGCLVQVRNGDIGTGRPMHTCGKF